MNRAGAVSCPVPANPATSRPLRVTVQGLATPSETERDMGKHGNQDKPSDSGSGGSAGGDGQDPNKHGSEPIPPQSGDGQDPNR